MHHKLWIVPLALGFVVGGTGTSSPTYALLNIPNLGILDTVTKVTKIDFGRADQSAQKQLQMELEELIGRLDADPEFKKIKNKFTLAKLSICQQDWTSHAFFRNLMTEYQAAKSQTDPKFKDPAYAKNYMCTQLNWGN
jgi:hypothetical protein